MFAYCNNNPSYYVDREGEAALLIALIVIGVCAVVGAVLGATSDRNLVGSLRQDSVDSGSTNKSTPNVTGLTKPNATPKDVVKPPSTSSNSPVRQDVNVSTPDITSNVTPVIPSANYQPDQSGELTVEDRIINGVIGFFAGAAFGGLCVATFGAGAYVFAGAGLQTFAFGAAIFDASACVVAPFLGTEFEMIELTP